MDSIFAAKRWWLSLHSKCNDRSDECMLHSDCTLFNLIAPIVADDRRSMRLNDSTNCGNHDQSSNDHLDSRTIT